MIPIVRRGLLCVLAALAVTAALAPAAGARVQAFLLTSSPDSLRDLRAHAGSIGVLYPTYFDCSVPSGRITGQDSPIVTAYARSKRIPLMPRVNCQDGATVHRILTTPGLRAVTLAHLVAIARTQRLPRPVHRLRERRRRRPLRAQLVRRRISRAGFTPAACA